MRVEFHNYNALEQFNEPTAPLVEKLGNVFL